MTASTLVWFRDDLRTADNPALNAALHHGETVFAVYVLENDPALRPIGGAATAWLMESLRDLSSSLASLGIELLVEPGSSKDLIPNFADNHKVGAVFWNRRYGPAERNHDAALKKNLSDRGLDVRTFNANLLVEPWDITTTTGKSYGVFTPFWRNLRQHTIPLPLETPPKRANKNSLQPAALPSQPHWAPVKLRHWKIGEQSARHALVDFLENTLPQYADGRDVPSQDYTSRLSPHLRFGEISPRQIWHATLHHTASHPAHNAAGEKFLSEIAWREFSYHLLYHREDIASTPMQARFSSMPWRDDQRGLRAWKKGVTGIPIIDAGMRQLWQTGWMHNRVRMLTASFLTKTLLIDWREGERWFWDTLVDADPANNPASWQWVAGSGADASPWFRIFNPVTQGQKFDPDGTYVRQFVPELSQFDRRYIHAPWEAPEDVRASAGIQLGKDYPLPIADLRSSRGRALEAYRETGG